MKKLFLFVCAFTGIMYQQNNVEWNTFEAKEVDNHQLDEHDNDFREPPMHNDQYNDHKDNDYLGYSDRDLIPDEYLIPDEDFESDQVKLRYSDLFSNFYGSLKSFVTGFVPEYNKIEQTKDVDDIDFDNLDHDDFNEPILGYSDRDQIPDEDLEPEEDLEPDQVKLRYSDHFANLYGSLQYFVSGFIPEWNVFQQKKGADHLELDDYENYDFDEPILDNDQDDIEHQDQDTFRYEDKDNLGHTEQDGSKHPDSENLEDSPRSQDENLLEHSKENTYTKDSEDFEEYQNNYELKDFDNFEKEKQIPWGSYVYGLLHRWFNQPKDIESSDQAKDIDISDQAEKAKDLKLDDGIHDNEHYEEPYEEQDNYENKDRFEDPSHENFAYQDKDDYDSYERANYDSYYQDNNDNYYQDNYDKYYDNYYQNNYDKYYDDQYQDNYDEYHQDNYDNYNPENYGRYDPDNYGSYDTESYGRYDPYDSYETDNYGRYDPESYGSYETENYGRYDPENYGSYETENYGKYDPENYGSYDTENYGRYDPESYGRYETENYGDYDHPENYGSYDPENYGNYGENYGSYDDPENYGSYGENYGSYDDPENYYKYERDHHSNYYKDNPDHEYSDNDNYDDSEQESHHDTKEESSHDSSTHEDTDQEKKVDQKDEQVDFLGLFPDNFEEILRNSQKTRRDEEQLEHFDEDDFSEENTSERESDVSGENSDEEDLKETQSDDEQENFEDLGGDEKFSLDEKAKRYFNMFAWQADHSCMSKLRWFFKDVDDFLEEKMAWVYYDVGVAIDVVSGVMTYYLEGLARVLAPIDFGLVKLAFIILIHAVYIFMASKWVSRRVARPVPTAEMENQKEAQEKEKESMKLEEEEEDEFFDGLENCVGDSKVPGIFQDPEAVITTSVDPKSFPEIESVIEKRKDVELTGEQEKKELQRPRRIGRNRNLFAGVPSLCTVVNPLRMKLPGIERDDDEHISMRRRMKAQKLAMRASTSKTAKNHKN